MFLVEITLYVALFYLAVGILFAVWFVVFEITEYDESAKGTGVFFRLIIFFGAMIFWVLLLKQILQGKEKAEVTAHRK